MSTARPILDPAVRRARERSRLKRSEIKARSVRSVETARARSALNIAESEAQLAQRTAYRRQRDAERAQAAAAASRSRSVNPVGAVQTVNKGSAGHNVMLVIFTIFLLIVWYKLATAGASANAFLTSVGGFLHTVSSNAPLFVANVQGSDE